jgi:hypothetical protein
VGRFVGAGDSVGAGVGVIVVVGRNVPVGEVVVGAVEEGRAVGTLVGAHLLHPLQSHP